MNRAEAGLASGAELDAEEVARDLGVLEQGGSGHRLVRKEIWVVLSRRGADAS